MPEQSVSQLLTSASQQLTLQDNDARLEAEILLAFLLKKDRSWLYTWPERILPAETCAAYFSLIEQRADGTPVSHITGEREFWGLRFAVNSHTLIPRPETELLVETLLARFPLPTAKVLDLGTGSGAIAIALAREKPQWEMTATDQSQAALELAKANADKHSVSIHFLESDWFENISDQTFNIIVSNPPYIEADDPHLRQGDLRFEPLSALVSGNDGLDDIRHIIFGAPPVLAANGWLLLEHGYNQGPAVRQLLESALWQQVETLQDYAGHDRITLARRPE